MCIYFTVLFLQSLAHYDVDWHVKDNLYTNFGHQFENRYSYETKRKLDTVSTSYGSKSTGQIEYVVNAQPVHVSSYEDATSSDSCAGQ